MQKYITCTAIHTIPFVALAIAALSPNWATAAQAALTMLLYLAWNRDFTARIEARARREVESELDRVRSELDRARAELALVEPALARVKPALARVSEDQRALRALIDDVERNLASEAARLVAGLTRRTRRAGALTEEQQIELVRRYAHGESVAKLALDMNVSERTVQNVLHRFRKR